MKHIDSLYRKKSREADLLKASRNQTKDTVQVAYDSISDLIINHAVPILGLFPEQTQNLYKNKYSFLKQLDPKRASISSAIILGGLGYLMTQLYGDGGLGLTYMYSHKEFGDTLDKPVYFPLGNWSATTTTIVAYFLMADSALRVSYSLFRGKTLAFGASIIELFESTFSTSVKLLKLQESRRVAEVREEHDMQDSISGKYHETMDLERRLESEGLNRHKRMIDEKNQKD